MGERNRSKIKKGRMYKLMVDWGLEKVGGVYEGRGDKKDT
jgi:hypothetical protein